MELGSITSTRQPALLLERHALVIPVYNHAGPLAEVIRRALELAIPVFVVDDGSTDGSRAVARQFGAIRLLCHRRNQGKGAALLTGLAAAAEVADWAITVDADGQHDPREAAALVRMRPPGARPILVGKRMQMDGRHVPWTSRFGRRFSNFWVRAAGGPRMADSQCGFRVYPLPEVLQLQTRARRFEFEVEVLARARWSGIPVLEAPVGVSYAPGRISHFRPFRDFCRNALTFTRLILLRLLGARRRRMLPPGGPIGGGEGRPDRR